MATVPLWLKGDHLTAITVTPCTVDADGLITDGSAGSLAGYVDYIRYESDPQLEMIQSLDRQVAHYIRTLEDFMIVVGEILAKKNANRTPVLPNIAATSDIIKITFTRGGQTYTMYGQRGTFRDGVSQFGKNVCELTIRPIDIGGADPGNPVTFTN